MASPAVVGIAAAAEGDIAVIKEYSCNPTSFLSHMEKFQFV